MEPKPRRRFLHAALVGAGAALWGVDSRYFGAPVYAQTASVFNQVELRGGLHQLSGAGGNVVLLGGSSGVAMVDSGSLEQAPRLMALLSERFPAAPLELVFNTHWHLDHTGGNEAAARLGASIVAHENTRLWMSTEFYVDWQDRMYPARPVAAQPTNTFYSSDPQPIALEFGSERIEYGLLREAHTDGDIYVRFPERNIIVAGGAVTAGRYPVLDYATGGLLGGLIEATQLLLDMSDAETLFVPAFGPAQVRSDVVAQLDMLVTVSERIRNQARQGKSVEEMLAVGITKEFDGRWGNNAARFVSNAYSSLWGISA